MSEPCKCYEHRHSSNPTDVIGIGKASRILQNAGIPCHLPTARVARFCWLCGANLENQHH